MGRVSKHKFSLKKSLKNSRNRQTVENAKYDYAPSKDVAVDADSAVDGKRSNNKRKRQPDATEKSADKDAPKTLLRLLSRAKSYTEQRSMKKTKSLKSSTDTSTQPVAELKITAGETLRDFNDRVNATAQKDIAHTSVKSARRKEKFKAYTQKKKRKSKALSHSTDSDESDLSDNDDGAPKKSHKKPKHDTPVFGDVVQAPPTALKPPKKIANMVKSKKKEDSNSVGGMRAQQLMEETRLAAIQHYRDLKLNHNE